MPDEPSLTAIGTSQRETLEDCLTAMQEVHRENDRLRREQGELRNQVQAAVEQALVDCTNVEQVPKDHNYLRDITTG